jgi:flagellar biosynthesis protein FlhB
MKLSKLNPIPAIKKLFTNCMTLPDYNSRLVFLTNAAVIHCVLIWQTWDYLHSTTKDSNYVSILAVLVGGHAVNGASRFLTKRVKEADDAKDDAPTEEKG